MTEHPLCAFSSALADAFAATNRRNGQALAKRIRSLADVGPAALDPSTVPCCRFLQDACGAAPDAMSATANAITAASAHLNWREAPGDSVPAHFRNMHAYAELAGPDGHFPATGFRCGIHLQAPGIHYPAHAHAAEEFYLIVSGEPLWQLDHGEWLRHTPGSLIRHHSGQPHAMKAGDAALLALWVWQGDIGFESYRFLQDAPVS